MPALTIVLPIFNVERYLSRCLDSVLCDPSLEVEVVGVDDASTDSSGEILDAYATNDARVVAVHFTENRGLGGARNEGLRTATGTHVWFVDSDDWVCAPMLPRILERLQATAADLLLLGHAVVRQNGELERERGDAHLRGLPDRFTVAERPEVTGLKPVAWNRIFRRQFLLGLSMPFPGGLYEDVAVTGPSLCAAGSVSAIDEVCMYYRLRDGSITSSSDRRHFDLLNQYDLMFDRLTSLPPAPPALPAHWYAVMVSHVFALLGTGRIEDRLLPEFFAEASSLANRRRPEPLPKLAPTDRMRLRLLLGGNWRRTSLFRRAFATTKSAATRGSRAAALAASVWRAFRSGLARPLMLAYYRFQLTRPVDDELAVFSAFWGEQGRCDNPKAIDEAVERLAPSIRRVWVTTADRKTLMPDDVDLVIRDSMGYYRCLARAKYLVNNVNFGGAFVKRPESVFLQTHHGTPLKAMGVDERHLSTEDANALIRRCRTWTFGLSSNAHSSIVWQMAYPFEQAILEYGYPRNDVLVNADVTAIAAARHRLGIAPGETAILFAPTHRDHDETFESGLDSAALVRELGAGHVVLERAHHRHRVTDPIERSAGVRNVSTEPIEDLYLASDVLITDYSSVMFDFALLDRPIIIFAPDLARYCERRGTYLDIAANAPGPFATDQETVVRLFNEGGLYAESSERLRAEFRDRFCRWDHGDAAERVVRRVFLDEERVR